MLYQRRGRPMGRPRIPKHNKRRTIAVRLPPETAEAIKELNRRGGYPSRTAFIEQAVRRAVSAAR